LVFSSAKHITSFNEPQVPQFKESIHGPNAFYKKADYVTSTEKDLSSNKLLPIVYQYNTESKVARIAKLIFFIIIFPVGLCQLLHSLVGALFCLLVRYRRLKLLKNVKILKLNHYIGGNSQSGESPWLYKRFSIDVNGQKIDVMITGKESTLNNGRWLLASCGNGELYEDTLCSHEFKHILSSVNSNAIVFNYPGVGSNGLPNKKAMVNAYRAMLAFLEDKNKGLGAKEIIGYGHSIGGGIQGEALKEHKFNPNINYVFSKSRTFSNLSTVVADFSTKSVGFLAKLFGWNIESTFSSKN
jgi:Chlamydia CHLPS protein (DUF818)